MTAITVPLGFLFTVMWSKKRSNGRLTYRFENSDAKVVFPVSCDMPLISSEAVNRLFKLADKDSIIAATVEERVFLGYIR